MCLSLFLEQKTTVGRVVGLDEAHKVRKIIGLTCSTANENTLKYMNAGAEASTLTNTLLSTIRLQRHLGTRVFISTQEPTISPKLLDLCSITIVHRFTSPEWLRCLRSHLAALSDHDDDSSQSSKVLMINTFNQIVRLRVGEALIFAPSAIIGVEKKQNENGVEEPEMKRLGMGYLKIKVRARVTLDGGKSVFAMGAQPTSSGAKTSGNLFGFPAAKPAFGTPAAGTAASGGIKATTSLFGSSNGKIGAFEGNAFGGNKSASAMSFGTASTSTINTPIFGSVKTFASSTSSQPAAATTFGAPSPPTNYISIFSSGHSLAAADSPFSSITHTSTFNSTNTLATPSSPVSFSALNGQNFDPFKSSSRTTITGTFSTSLFSMFSFSLNASPGSRYCDFQTYIEKEPNCSTYQQNCFQDIGFQPVCQKFSHEELRLADYTLGSRYGNL
jgi:hypothetical protein